MTPNPRRRSATAPRQNWRQIVAKYQTPDLRRSMWQLVSSLAAYFGLLTLMYFSLDVSYWLTLLLAIPAAGFMVRLFIIFHDCGHQSFFASRRLNDLVGAITGVITFTPYYRWRHAHAIHHATAGDLDRREVGDVWTMTVKEYLEAPKSKQIAYRIYRNPLIIFTLGAWLSFILGQRIPLKEKSKRELMSILYTDLALLAVFVVVALTIGLGDFLLVLTPVLMLGTSAGIWLFYVQHQFEGVYWERHEDWDFVDAALKGSSFYKLPKILQWFSGNIGFHHIHHLSPKIPNYKLEQAYKENELFHIQPITLRSSMRSLRFRLWDEDNRQLVGFGHLKTLPKAQPATP